MILSCVIMNIPMQKTVEWINANTKKLFTLLCILYTNTSFTWSYPVYFIICWKYVTTHSMNFLILKNQIIWYSSTWNVHPSCRSIKRGTTQPSDQISGVSTSQCEKRTGWPHKMELSKCYLSTSLSSDQTKGQHWWHKQQACSRSRKFISYLGWNTRKKATTKIRKS
jgi:hypothetical protein